MLSHLEFKSTTFDAIKAAWRPFKPLGGLQNDTCNDTKEASAIVETKSMRSTCILAKGVDRENTDEGPH